MSILRYSILPVLLFVFVFTSCSKKKDDDVTPSVNRADLIGKTWISTSFDVTLDGKKYSKTGQEEQNIWQFKDNGDFVSSDKDGNSETGKWSLEGNKLKITPAGETSATFLPIQSLKGSNMVISLAENLDLTKNEQDYTIMELNALYVAAMVLDGQNVDLLKGKKVSVVISFKAN